MRARDEALARIQDVVQSEEKVKGDFAASEHAYGIARDKINSLESEVTKWRSISNGKQGSLGASLKTALEKLQVATASEVRQTPEGCYFCPAL